MKKYLLVLPLILACGCTVSASTIAVTGAVVTYLPQIIQAVLSALTPAGV